MVRSHDQVCLDWLSEYLLCSDWLSHQLFLQVNGPDDSIVAHSEDKEEEEGQLSVTHLPHSSVVENWLPPIRKAVHQDVIIPAHARTHIRDFIYI